MCKHTHRRCLYSTLASTHTSHKTFVIRRFHIKRMGTDTRQVIPGDERTGPLNWPVLDIQRHWLYSGFSIWTSGRTVHPLCINPIHCTAFLRKQQGPALCVYRPSANQTGPIVVIPGISDQWNIFYNPSVSPCSFNPSPLSLCIHAPLVPTPSPTLDRPFGAGLWPVFVTG